MAGHEHGGAAMAGAAAPVQRMELSEQSRRQLEDVLAAAGQAQQAAQKEEVAVARAAFAELERAVQAVDMTLLEGHARMVWKDLAMRLGNDAFEGKEAQTSAGARRVAESLATNTASLRSQFNLGQAPHAASGPVEVVPAAFRRQLAAVFAAYFTAGKALAADDAAQAAAALADMATSMGAVDASVLSGPARDAWMRHKTALDAALVYAAKVRELQALRETFAPLSDEAASLARRFPPDGQAYFLMHCPMAFNGRGAVWIQDTPQVRNPYFGSAMPDCGEVWERIGVPGAPTSAPASAPATAAAEHAHD